MTTYKEFNAKFNWALMQGFKKAFDFKSRATRMEFWIFSLTMVFFERLIERFADPYFFPGNEWDPISLFFAFIFLVPSISVIIRRLHDTNRSAWWLFLYPTLIGIPFLIYFYCVKGSDKKNNYGPPRKKLQGE